ncbi:loricrin, putative [Trichomonas vaginalis G3]|uniref:receptor protein-tyrosine kinase n=1 Tax=Trichomonas vaginalis (strain ATCC PRA-98 / G3) TaxID=412133 RepID=A2FGI7_TRIV3|nr:glycine-rich protein family [Trichomonas vaginalis G3]EAX96001.1 loricrin, putative [Trichomonas vaginalis G3]KAI5537668.1 glycine-rich protein family [Trichomonas vaginalis G3]|eukprot:XP_001308931.1 loricrin [Trichomonas vaginalis G3]
MAFNGGGWGGNTESGGGATDLRLNVGSYRSRFLIAGGGGGRNDDDEGPSCGCGGGLSGGFISNYGIGGNQTHPGMDQDDSTKNGNFGYGFSNDPQNNLNIPGGGGGLFGGATTAGGSGFVYSSSKTDSIDDLPSSITVENGMLGFSNNADHGYAIITSLSSSSSSSSSSPSSGECNCIVKCQCSRSSIFRTFHFTLYSLGFSVK